jgi:hypothetical protein
MEQHVHVVNAENSAQRCGNLDFVDRHEYLTGALLCGWVINGVWDVAPANFLRGW